MAEIFLVVGYLPPTKKESEEEGSIGTIVVPMQTLLARDEAHAVAQAYKFIPETHAKHEARVQFRCLPFRKPAG